MTIILTYSKSNRDHGICGHFYEVCDYALILSNFFNVTILIRENYKSEDILLAISKYTSSDQYKLLELIRISTKKVIGKKGDILIITDGNIREIIQNEIVVLHLKNIILFPCGKTEQYKDLPTIYTNKIIILHDARLNYNIPPSIHNHKHYIKKINFKALEPIKSTSNDYLMYATNNCKLITNDTILKYMDNLPKGSKLIILINKNSPLLDNKIENEKIIYSIVPIYNIFDYFKNYIYTPIMRKWDCSPRLLAECKYQNKNIIIDTGITDEYLNQDLGLKWRLHDIYNNFESLYLNIEDEIVYICKYLCDNKNFQEYINDKYLEEFKEIDKALIKGLG